jgi:hypothetical protein
MTSTKAYVYTSLFAISCVLFFSCNKNDTSVIAWVNQYPVSSAEFKHWMLLQRAEVHNYFYNKYQLADSEDFWETEKEGESPLEMLKEMALEKALRCKVQQITALEKGIVDHIDFDRMMLEMQEENLKRKRKIENGEVVYGAKRYTERTYFAHEFDKLVIQLKAVLAKDELKPAKKDLEALIENEDYPLEEHTGFYQLQYVENNYDHYIDSLVNTAAIELNNKNWNALNAFFN